MQPVAATIGICMKVIDSFEILQMLKKERIRHWAYAFNWWLFPLVKPTRTGSDFVVHLQIKQFFEHYGAVNIR